MKKEAGELRKTYPNATKWASPKVRPSAQKQGFGFDHDLTDSPAPAWATDIDQVIARGGRFMEEVIFFHKTSKTLILADMIENFESSKLPYWIRPLAKIGEVLSPNGSTPKDLRLTYWGHHQQMQKALDTIMGWHPQTIIMAHGKIITENTVQRLKKAFRWV